MSTGVVLGPLGRVFVQVNSDAPYNWPWATRLELQSHPQFVAASAGPGCEWEGPSCAPRPALPTLGPGIGQQKS